LRITIDRFELKKKNRKSPWIWYCDSCKKKLELDSGDVYYETRGDYGAGLYVARVCSYKCGEHRVKDIAKTMYLSLLHGTECGVLDLRNQPFDELGFKRFYNHLDKPTANEEGELILDRDEVYKLVPMNTGEKEALVLVNSKGYLEKGEVIAIMRKLMDGLSHKGYDAFVKEHFDLSND